MTLVTRPFAHMKELDSIGTGENVGRLERIISGALGIGLLGLGLWRRSPAGIVLGLAGGALAYRGASGHCALYGRMGIDTAHGERGVRWNRGIKVEESTHIETAPEELFRFWRNLSNLPRFMPHLELVEEQTDRVSHWVVKGPVETRLEWDAEIINETPGRMISWQSLPGAMVENAGSVRFDPSGRGTMVRVTMQYRPQGGKLGAAVAAALGADPKQQVRENLRRLKDLAESGATITGTAV